MAFHKKKIRLHLSEWESFDSVSVKGAKNEVEIKEMCTRGFLDLK